MTLLQTARAEADKERGRYIGPLENEAGDAHCIHDELFKIVFRGTHAECLDYIDAKADRAFVRALANSLDDGSEVSLGPAVDQVRDLVNEVGGSAMDAEVENDYACLIAKAALLSIAEGE